MSETFEPFYTRSYSRDKTKKAVGLGYILQRRDWKVLGIPIVE